MPLPSKESILSLKALEQPEEGVVSVEKSFYA